MEQFTVKSDEFIEELQNLLFLQDAWSDNDTRSVYEPKFLTESANAKVNFITNLHVFCEKWGGFIADHSNEKPHG